MEGHKHKSKMEESVKIKEELKRIKSHRDKERSRERYKERDGESRHSEEREESMKDREKERKKYKSRDKEKDREKESDRNSPTGREKRRKNGNGLRGRKRSMGGRRESVEKNAKGRRKKNLSEKRRDTQTGMMIIAAVIIVRMKGRILIRTIFDLMAEEAREKNRLVSNLNKVIEEKDMHLKEIQSRVTETSKALSIAMTERDKLNEELKKIQLGATEHFQKITNDHKIKKLKLQIETQMRNNEEQREELKKREARNESEMKKLLEEIEMNKSKNSSLELASLEHQRADASVYKLAEDQKRQKEELHKSIIQLEKQIDAKHALEVEITTLRGNLNVKRQLATGGDVEKIKEVEEMMQVLRDREEEIHNAETLIQYLIVKARKSNDDVQDARKEFINGLKDMNGSGLKKIGVKRMGEIDIASHSMKL
ncbi:hypothetical protein QQ045_011981 [Rhodiola kirilowii]